MKQIILCLPLLFALLGCDAVDAIKATKAMPKKMDDMNRKMDQTNQGVHKQTLLIALDNLSRAENWEYVLPVPYDLMPYAKEFAEAATPQELLELTYLWLEKINNGRPTPPIGKDGDGNPFVREDGTFSPEAVKKINNEKMVRLIILQAMAGFAPQTTIDQMIQNEVYQAGDGSGRLQSTLYSLLMMRVQFIRDVLLDNSVMAAKMTHVGHFEKAIALLEQIEVVASLPFADEIQLKIKGFLKLDGTGALPDDMQVAEKLDVREIGRRWNSLSIRINECEGFQLKGKTPADEARLKVQYTQRVDRVKSRVATRLASLK